MVLGTIGKYEKLDVLGHGVSGIVYLAWDKLLGKHVALKEISLQSADEDRFLEEARVLDRLRHPNIVQVNSVDRLDGHMIIDMEYVKGTNLHEYMRSKGRLPVREALSVAVQVCDALDFAHRNRTVHRDVKPANVLITCDGIAKIVDFGLAEILGSGSYAGGAGTYAYMAPEDFEEVERSDHRSDIWAVGVTLYEMLTGRRPFQAIKAKDPFSWKRTVEEDEPAPLAEIDPLLPPRLQAVMDRALAKDKSRRYQSAGELRDDLCAILSTLGGPVRLSGLDVTGAPQALQQPAPSTGRQADQVSEVDATFSPSQVDFGRVRKGDSSTETLSVRIAGRGRTRGRVVSQPGWVSVTPQSFDHRKQKMVITADTEHVWKPGVYDEDLVIEVENEKVSIPLRLNVLPRRRSFGEVWWWYLPLLMLSVLPVSSQRGGRDAASLVSMGLLSVMLLIVTIAADLGAWEKLLPAIAAAVGLGATSGVFWKILSGGDTGLLRGDLHMIFGVLLSLFVALQLLTSSRWRMWAVLHALFAVSVSYSLMR